MSALPVAILGFPLLITLTLFSGWKPAQRALNLAAPIAAVPALLLAVTIETGWAVEVPWLLLGASFRLDETGHIMLLLVGLLWTVAGIYARSYLADDPRRSRFFAFFTLTMSGNLGVTISGDIATFYLFFAVMTFAAYGLVVHEGGKRALRAGRVYIAFAVLGEAFLIGGLLLAAEAAGGAALELVPSAVGLAPHRDLIVGLVLAGFGVKAGLLLFHMWLPLAHPVAPTPASAVLSGAIIKAGVLGWLRFLPLGEVALPFWGGVCIVLGLGAAFYGVIIGLPQPEPKTNLAYSSISQVGLITAGVGIGLLAPDAGRLMPVLLALYAAHHGLAKAGLFLGSGVVSTTPAGSGRRWLVIGGLGLCALTLAGAPLTTGALAKGFIAYPAAQVPGPWPSVLGVLLPLTAVGTTLLMARLLLLLRCSVASSHAAREAPGLFFPWLTLVGVVAIAAWIVPPFSALNAVSVELLSLASIWSSSWPILVGLLLVLLALRAGSVADLRLPSIPPGDILSFWPPIVELARAAASAVSRPSRPPLPGRLADVRGAFTSMFSPAESGRGQESQIDMQIPGLLALALLLVLFLLFQGGSW